MTGVPPGRGRTAAPTGRASWRGPLVTSPAASQARPRQGPPARASGHVPGRVPGEALWSRPRPRPRRGPATLAAVDAHDLLRFVLDPGRLAVLGALAARPGTATDLASRAHVAERAALTALGDLRQGGLVDLDEAGRYHLRTEALRDLARTLPTDPPVAERIGYGMTPDEQAVLARFFSGERLLEVPAARGKRRVVLERLALEFEPGVRFSEAEVNERLAAFHDDYASLRRYLVDEGLLDRDSGQYWRAGGRVT